LFLRRYHHQGGIQGWIIMWLIWGLNKYYLAVVALEVTKNLKIVRLKSPMRPSRRMLERMCTESRRRGGAVYRKHPGRAGP